MKKYVKEKALSQQRKSTSTNVRPRARALRTALKELKVNFDAGSKSPEKDEPEKAGGFLGGLLSSTKKSSALDKLTSQETGTLGEGK